MRSRYGYLADPTDQLAVPGLPARTEITPEGSLVTDDAELSFRAGRRLSAWRQPTRTALDGGLPVISGTLVRSGVRYTVTAGMGMAGGAAVDVVRVTLRAAGRTRAVGRFAADLAWSRGASRANGTFAHRFPRGARHVFDPSWQSAWDGARLVRDGRVVLIAGDGPGRALTAPATAPLPASPAGSAAYRVTLAPGRTVTLGFVLPVDPAAPGAPVIAAAQRLDPGAALRGIAADWHDRLREAVGIDVPERKVRESYRAALVAMLLPRFRDAGSGAWIQAVNALQYHSFFLRDGAVITNALDLAGLHGPAAENVAALPGFQRPDGLFITRPDQYDGVGQALWTIGRHARLSGDDALARSLLPAIDRAVDWIADARAHDPDGLLPASTPRDDEFVTGHLTGDDLWAVAGLRESVALAQRLGENALAAAWQAQLDGIQTALLKQANTAAATFGHGAIPPSLDGPGGHTWGNLWVAYPSAFLPARAPLVRRTMTAARAAFGEGLARYGRLLHGYLGFRVFETELERGAQRAALRGLFDELAHTTATNGGWEMAAQPWTTRHSGPDIGPHGWWAAEYVTLLRNLLVRESSADRISVLGALPSAWIAPGRRVRVRHAPTLFGPVDLDLRAERGGAVLRWHATVPPGVTLSWALPPAAHAVRARHYPHGARVLVLRSRSGRLRVRWRLANDGLSFASSARALQAAYRMRGLAPPAGRPR